MQWVDEWLMNARSQADRRPLVLLAPHKLVGKALVSGGAREWEHPIPKSRSVRSWGDRRGHPALRDVCGRNQPNGTRVCEPSWMSQISVSQHPGRHLFSAIFSQCGWKGFILLILWADLWLVYLDASPTLLML